MPHSDLLLATVTLFSVGLFYFFWPRSNLPLPPSRKGWPLIGNLLEIPASYEWKAYHQWCKSLDILYLNIMGTNLIVLDNVKTATDLLDKRSSLYSGRPIMPMVNKLMGYEFLLPFMDYGSEWRQCRRLMDQQFHPSSIRQFHPHLLKVTRRMLTKFLVEPEGDVLENIRHMTGEMAMYIGYGLTVQPHDDPYIATAKEAMSVLTKACLPGAFLVDTFPILRYVPEWVPGAGFKTKARIWKKMAQKMVEAPYAAAAKNIESGIFIPSFTSINLKKIHEGLNPKLYTEQNIQSAAGTIYSAGSDTSVSAIGSCILGLLNRPDVVAKAQQELDHVLHPGHLPDFNDHDGLPYITAIVREALRWREVTPIAFPHLLKTDDVYRGYRIPAGSMVIANTWAMLHDEKVYPDPFTFNPDRFMKDGKLDLSVPDPGLACWGFGRRICPGRHLAYASLWIVVASLLAVFDIEKAVDSQGNGIEPLDETVLGIVSTPAPYRCSIKPRSEHARRSMQSYKN